MSTINELGGTFAKIILVFGPIYLLAGEGYKFAYFLGIIVFLSILLTHYQRTGKFSSSIADNAHVSNIQRMVQGLGL